ncbi:hypothetical protein TIFTF001_012587 [Ficus carica]|uniref:Uncharacterized protein n=1 Tax=Ficus carica TaxID=3494 RepID=A0AA88DI38_FICCA|nr:hypothetical protein TIFTF001_012587 [Ficus carica]
MWVGFKFHDWVGFHDRWTGQVSGSRSCINIVIGIEFKDGGQGCVSQLRVRFSIGIASSSFRIGVGVEYRDKRLRLGLGSMFSFRVVVEVGLWDRGHGRVSGPWVW